MKKAICILCGVMVLGMIGCKGEEAPKADTGMNTPKSLDAAQGNVQKGNASADEAQSVRRR
jgi:hypothetical protein